MNDGKVTKMADGEFGVGAQQTGGVALAATFGNNRQGEQVEHVPVVPADPAHPAVVVPAPAQVIPVAVPPAPVEAAPDMSGGRQSIADRFKARRASHDVRFTPDHVPPFVEHATQPQPQPQPQPPQPTSAPQAPAFTLKVRGRDIPVSGRDELLRLAEVEQHEVADFTDNQLVRLAQKQVAASTYLDEARETQKQARVTAPAPAAGTPPAGEQQPTPAAPAPTAPNVEQLRLAMVDRMQLGSTEEAAQAQREYEEAAYREREARANESRALQQHQQQVQQDVNAFAQRNTDITSDPNKNDFLFMAATREMGADLQRIGLTEQQIQSAMTNPKEMTDAFVAARRAGYPVRPNAEILEAAAGRVRQAFGMQHPASSPNPTPPPNAAATRLDEKRGLQAQPVRSGYPTPTPPQPQDPRARRSAVIQQMKQARTAPNGGQFGL